MKRTLLFFSFIVVLQIALSESLYAQTPAKIEKEANKLFKDDQYVEATPMYLQLLSLEPRNHFYNYRYGACLLFNSEKKPEALKYLKFSVNAADIEPEAFYFLARAYHVNFYFDKAIQSYNRYKLLVKDKAALKHDVDRQIEMCQNGKKLVRNVKEIAVKTRTSSTYDNFFRQYNMKDIGGSIIVAEDFQTKIDVKKEHKPVVHISNNADILFYSSYGDKDLGHKDIFMRLLNAKGEWGDPIRLPNAVNTDFDEDFPYLDAAQTYLYFSSRGHNSMGGYDIFRIPFDGNNLTFGEVQNMDFAISSPDDDLFYVVDKDNQHAYFASARQSEGGKIHVYRIAMNTFSGNTILCAGAFHSSIVPDFKTASITIIDVQTNQVIDKIQAKPINGAFAFSVPKEGKYEFIVETEVFKEGKSVYFDVPSQQTNKLLKINVLEEKNDASAHILIVPDFNFKFDDDQREDIIASMLLSKSELLPNEAIWELVENDGPNSDISTSQNALIETYNELNLTPYKPSELHGLAKKDLIQLKENYKNIEAQKQGFLFLAQEKITELTAIDAKINALVQRGEQNGLTAIEHQQLSELLEKRLLLLTESKAAIDAYNVLVESSKQVNEDIALSDAVRANFEKIKTENDLETLELLNAEQLNFIKNKRKWT